MNDPFSTFCMDRGFFKYLNLNIQIVDNRKNRLQ